MVTRRHVTASRSWGREAGDVWFVGAGPAQLYVCVSVCMCVCVCVCVCVCACVCVLMYIGYIGT